MKGNEMENNEYENTSVFNINFLLISLNEEEILDLVRPAQTCSFVQACE